MDIDQLTGLWNQKAGEERLALLIERGKQEKESITVALYDLNDLKRISDEYGQIEGDRFLCCAASASREMLEERDLIFRLDGDKFVLAFYGKGSKIADNCMHQLQRKLKKSSEEQLLPYMMTLSYGLVKVYPEDNYTISQIIEKADSRMYIQKRDYHILRAKDGLTSIDYSRQMSVFQYDKERLYDALIASTDDYIFVGNMKTGIFRYPPSMVEEFGLPSQIVENAAAFWGELIHPHDAKKFLESNQEIADGRADYHSIEYRAKNVHGEWIWLRCRGKMLRDSQGTPDLFAGMIINLGKKNQIDHMTGLYNRFEFEGNIKKYLVNVSEISHIGIMILDMDTFKDINDLYNRSFGDEILRITAWKVASLLPANAQIYRLDGDEFGIIILNDEEETYKDIFGRIQEEFDRQQEYNGRRYHCTLSAGYAVYPEDADNYLDLMKSANYALEHAKQMGKNRLEVFSGDIILERARNLEMTEKLRECIERGFVGFSVNYQPQVEAGSKKLYGAEALARWEQPEYGRVSPEEFIPLLEQSGLIVELGRWVFKEAAKQCKKWREFHPDFHISVNLSYVQLIKDDIVSFACSELERIGLDKSAVTLELTETYLAKEDDIAAKSMNELQKRGFLVAMDDFGTGYSSLRSLRTIPVNIVKIDREFSMGITSDAFSITLVRATTQLCHEVGKKVCLEGIETEEEYNIVKGIGLEWIQGYYFGRPVAAEEFPIA